MKGYNNINGKQARIALKQEDACNGRPVPGVWVQSSQMPAANGVWG